MKRITARLSRYVPPVLTANVAARVVALLALTAATILVAHAGGPKLLGELTLLRVLPGLVGVLVSCGLPGAAPYFLASREYAALPRLRSTLFALTLGGALAASACWLILSPVLHGLFFRPWHMGVVLAAAVPVFSQLWVAAGKAFLQGENDMRAANVAIGAEEAAFLPVYLALLPFLHGTGLLMTALVGADVLVTAGIAVRLAWPGGRHAFAHQPAARRGHPRRAGRPGHARGVRGRVKVRRTAPAAWAGRDLRALPAPGCA
jgi:O-antigen/teichoic acid export membrane protein